LSGVKSNKLFFPNQYIHLG